LRAARLEFLEGQAGRLTDVQLSRCGIGESRDLDGRQARPGAVLQETQGAEVRRRHLFDLVAVRTEDGNFHSGLCALMAAKSGATPSGWTIKVM